MPGMRPATNRNVAREISARHSLLWLLALLGLGISLYLSLYQYGAIGAPWDPVFGSASSERVLDSALSRALPVHDGVFGVIAYSLEVLITGVLIAWPRRAPGWLAVALGILTMLMATISIVLIGVQALAVTSWCTLCLASACISLINAGLALPEERRAAAYGFEWAHQLLPAPHGRAGSHHQEL